MRALRLPAIAILLLATINGATPAPEDKPNFTYASHTLQPDRARTKARRPGKTLQRTYYKRNPKYHARRLSRWNFRPPTRPVGAPPAGYRAQLVRSPAALQSHIRQIDAINGQPVKIVAVCRPGGRFFSKTTGRWHKSEHDGCKAVDFTPRPERRSAVLAYARRNIPGYTLTYGWSPHIHIDLAKSRQAKRKQWPVAEISFDIQKSSNGTEAKVIPLPRVKQALIPLPRPRPVIAIDFAEQDIIPPDMQFNLALIDTEAMPVGLVPAAPAIEYEDPLLEARRYLVATATPGFTMQLQGVGLAIERLHPQFAIRLAAAIREARAAGLERAGIFSAYRPPEFGVGGFSDKFDSTHAYGLGTDLTGIGGPGSKASLQWHQIATKHKLYNPYGPTHRAEWNHYQPTWTRAIAKNTPLRKAITARGPIDLPRMWKIADSLIDRGPYKTFRVSKQKRKYAKRWSKKRWAAFKKKSKKPKWHRHASR